MWNTETCQVSSRSSPELTKSTAPGPGASGRILWGLMLVLLVAAGPWAVYRAAVRGGSDFPYFEDAGRFVAEHGTRHPRTALYRYLPSLDVACVPLTWLPVPVTATLWYAINVGCWLLLLRSIRRELLAGVQSQFAAEVTLAAGWLGLPLAIDGLLLGGFHAMMLWLMIAGLWQVSRGRSWGGGLLLGAATWLKLLPVFAVAYLVWRRKWKAVAVAMLAVVVINTVLTLPVYGWRESAELHAEWFWGDAVGTGDRQLAGANNSDEDRITNQSLLVVMRRFLTDRGGFPQLVLARLGENQMTLAGLSALGGLALAVWLLLRRSSRQGVADQGAEIALVTLCTVWFSPVVWSYHLIAAVPATAVVLSRLRQAWQRWCVIGLWGVGMALFTVELGRAAGHMLWVTFAVGGILAWTMLVTRRPEYSVLTSVSPHSEGITPALTPAPVSLPETVALPE
ncbi:MAG: DUF2029 domain-containing protein [Planctomycetes bacterium]|nr:DUF2029 domain-containing protein [Planctomycetota bacterium]